MYFAVIGNHPEITLKELQLIHPKNLEKKSDHLITFDTNEPDQLPNLASLIKRGLIFPQNELGKILWNTSCGSPHTTGREEDEVGTGLALSDKDDRRGVCTKRILWIADKNMGINLKKQYKMKRFKQVDILHTDMEVRNKGIELIKIPTNHWTPWQGGADSVSWQRTGGGLYGLVQGYQNIKLYEVVDFEKPARSMQTGMMPAKLTHTLINIALSYNKNASLIFDPFCWTGTTGFIANALGYNFIGSDIKLNLALTNEQRRRQQWTVSPYWGGRAKRGGFNKDLLFQFTEQDISKPLNPTAFSPLLLPPARGVAKGGGATLIVTEGRLGPVIKQTTTPAEIQEYQRRVKNLYLQFIQTITDFFPKDKKPVMVFTIPIYLGQGTPLMEGGGSEGTRGFIEEQISSLTSQLWRKMETLDEVYKRENQKVWRKIIILQ